MSYLVDSDVFIEASRAFYSFAVFPCFWTWIEDKGNKGIVHSVQSVQQELQAGNDALGTWATSHANIFVAPNAQTAAAMTTVATWAAGPSLPFPQAERTRFLSGADCWLVAEGLARGWTVVTREIPAPDSKTKIKIPDVCNALGVPWMNVFKMLEAEKAKFT